MTANINNTLYIVTGAAGNLGSAIVRKLVRDGEHVHALVLPGETAARHLPSGAEIFEGDVTDVSTLRPMFEGLPGKTKIYVIHCAAMVSVSTLVADKIWDVNVNGTQNIIDLCIEYNARLAFIGSTGAIPEQPRWAPPSAKSATTTRAPSPASMTRPKPPPASSCSTPCAASSLTPSSLCPAASPARATTPSATSPASSANTPRAKCPQASRAVFQLRGQPRYGRHHRPRACEIARTGESYILGGDMVGMSGGPRHSLSERTGLPTIKRILPAGLGKLMGHAFDLVGKKSPTSRSAPPASRSTISCATPSSTPARPYASWAIPHAPCPRA